MTSNFFYIFIIFLGFSILYLVTIYIQTLFAFKKDYAEYKCNPLMMPFSASFGENPVDVFNECIQAQQSATTEQYSSNLFSNLTTNNDNVSDINSMNAGTISDHSSFKNTIMGPDLGDMSMENEDSGESSSGILPQMGNTQKSISIQTIKMASASLNVSNSIMANIKSILVGLEALPTVMEGVYNSPPIQMVMNVGALAGN
tara:strand:- start:182 stop:784 length:603 start_codon:yes stop_codon:yes gene_type:complete